MDALAVILESPERLALQRLPLTPAGEADAVVAISWSGISTGTERLLWSGRMPPFPGMGYPLVPGYESVGIVEEAGHASGLRAGTHVFVPGARCFGPVRGLFGGAASRLVAPASRLVPVDSALGDKACLIALAATARRALTGIEAGARPLIVGHGVLGRLTARIAKACGAEPMVWETNPVRAAGRSRLSGSGPRGRHPPRLFADRRCQRPRGRPRRPDRPDRAGRGDRARGLLRGATVLRLPAGLHARGAHPRLGRVPAGRPVRRHRADRCGPALPRRADHPPGGADDAEAAYRTAFDDPACLKMILDWRDAA